MADRILIVDDDPASTLLLTTVLKEMGAQVLTVNESSAAVGAFYEFEPDLVVLDLHMPAPDGHEILRNLRTPRAFAGYLPVMVLTADTTRAARDRPSCLARTISSTSRSTGPRWWCESATCF